MNPGMLGLSRNRTYIVPEKNENNYHLSLRMICNLFVTSVEFT